MAQTLFLAVVILLAITLWRGRERCVHAAVATFVFGIIARALPLGAAELVSNAIIELSLALVLAHLLVPAGAKVHEFRRAIIQKRKQSLATVGLTLRGASEATSEPPNALPDLRPALIAGIVVSLFIALSTFAQASWPLIGARTGSIIWNAHVMGAEFVRGRFGLLDPFIGAHGQAVRVAILDSPFLTYLKFLHPGGLNGPGIMNVIGILSLWGMLLAGALVLRVICSNAWASAGAMLAFLALPLGFALRFAAPFDLVFALAVLAYVLSDAPRPQLAYAAALFCGLLNVASGYELAVLTAAFSANGYRTRTISAWLIVAFSLVGSGVCAVLMHASAPGVSLSQAWWATDQLPRIFWTEHISLSWHWILLAAVLACIGVIRMLRNGEHRELRTAATLASLAALFAIPTHVGGIPIVSPASLFAFLPLGIPSARMLELVAFAFTLPIAFGLRYLLLSSSAISGGTAIRALPWAIVAVLVFALLPKHPATSSLDVRMGTFVVEFPIAEGGSPAGLQYANDLLVDNLHIIQPLVFVDPGILTPRDQPGSPQTDEQLRSSHVGLVVLNNDYYFSPSLRTIEPQVYDAKAFSVPDLRSNPLYRLDRFSSSMSIYTLAQP